MYLQLRTKTDAAHYYTLKLIEGFTNEKRRKKKKNKKKTSNTLKSSQKHCRLKCYIYKMAKTSKILIN